MLNIIFYVFAAITALHLAWYLGILGKFAFIKPQAITPKKIPVSVIVSVKNNIEEVNRLIPALISQEYPDFEIVLVDNASHDETIDVLEAYEQQYHNIKLVKVENNEAFWANKKYALTLGIKAASKDYLLFIDVHCMPASNQWIASMVSQFTLSKTIVLGYSALQKKKNSLLNKLIRFDGMLAATGYFAWAKAGRPYTGNGRNLAYKKDEWYQHNGYIKHIKIRLGEDALFINEAATKKNTAICYTPESITSRESKKTYKEFIREKRKRLYTTRYFKPFDRLQLKAFFVLHLLFFGFAIALAILQYNWMFLVPAVVIRYIVTWVTLAQSAKRLNEKDTVYWYPFIEIMLIFTQLYAYIANLFKKPVHWR
jgi:glycosyltransferase involved in cell wall biosynthesis